MAFSFGNTRSIGLQNQIGQARKGLENSFLKLSSGKRLNSAKDDAAAVAISQAFEAQTRSYAQAERNIGSALSMVRTAESGAGQIGDMLGRMRELAVQSADGALSDSDRGFLDAEYQQLQAEVDRISGTTEFNGQNLLDGPAQDIAFQVGTGTDPSDQVSVGFGGVNASALGLAGTSLAGPDGSAGRSAIDAIDNALSEINTRRATFGAMSNRLDEANDNSVNTRTQLSSALSQMRDADMAKEASVKAQFQISLEASMSIFATANQHAAYALRLLG